MIRLNQLRALGETALARFLAAARVMRSTELRDGTEAVHFRYAFRCLVPRDRRAVIEIRHEIAEQIARALGRAFDPRRLILLRRELAAQLHDIGWEAAFVNTVATAGKTDMVSHEFAGSSYTAAWYLGLVDGASTPTFASADTMATHAGWTENQAYSQAARPTLAFAAASGGSIALSSAATFSINAAATIAGGFFATNSTKGGTTGTLYSAGAFTGGNKTCANGDTLNVSATQTIN